MTLRAIRTVLFILILTSLFACRSLNNGGSQDFVQVKVTIEQPDKNSANRSTASGVQTAAIFAIADSFTIDTIEQVTSWYDGQLQNLVDGTVTLTVPLNTPIKLAKWAYAESFTLNQIINGDDEPSAQGISDSFTVTGSDKTMTITIFAGVPPWGGTVQFGSAGNQDVAFDLAQDSSGNIYLTGNARGDLDGQSNQSPGSDDAFLVKLDASGVKQWTRLFGSTASENPRSIIIEYPDNIYISGHTGGQIVGAPAAFGPTDAFLTKYNSSGVRSWVKQYGTADMEQVEAVMLGSDNKLYMVGDIDGTWGVLPNDGEEDLYILRTDNDGSNESALVQATSSAGTNFDLVEEAVMDSNDNIIVTGSTEGNFGDSNNGDKDVFLHKYLSNGDNDWEVQFGGVAVDSGVRVAVDSSENIYVSGTTSNVLAAPGAGNSDFFLAKYNAAGSQQWLIQFGSTEADQDVGGLAVGSDGYVYFAGNTMGDMPANTDSGNTTNDIVLVKFVASSGAEVWRKQFGTTADEIQCGIAFDSVGNILMVGLTKGSLDGATPADSAGDAFVIKVDKNGNLL